MSFFVRCISGNSLKGMVRDDDDDGGSGGSTPNDTQHGGSKFSSYSWKRLSAKSRSSLNSPKKHHSPVLAATSADGTGSLRASMEPVMERTRSALTDLEAVKFLVEDWSHKQWRPATPQDQERFDRLEQSDIKPLVALGEGAYGSVNLCRVAANTTPDAFSPSGSTCPAITPAFASASAGSKPPQKTRSFSGTATASALSDTRAGFGSVSVPAHAAARHTRSVSGSASRFATLAAAAGAPGGAGPDATRPASAAADASAAPQEGKAGPLGSSPSDDGAAGAAAASSSSSPPSSPSGAASSGAAEELACSEAVTAREGGDGGAGQDGSYGPEGGGRDGGQGSQEGGSAGSAGPGASVPMQPASSINDPQLIVAVKRVPLGWNQERELMQLHRCQQCPFIVRLFGFVDDGSEHCSYVMEWAEGGDLGVMLSSLKSRRGVNKQRLLMSEASARYYMGCLLLALEFLHANGLLHRDIKPSNLLLTSDGTAKLADLGFTVALDANGQTVGCCGTTGYIAPEVYSYGSAKSRMAYGIPADVWSAGATLYQILTGQVVTEQPEEVIKKGWRPPSHPRFSHHLQDLLNRMLAVKPHSRPQSVASVMRHAWFTGFDWAALREGRMKAPYVPSERRRRRQTDPTSAAESAAAADASAPAAAAATPADSAAPAASLSGGSGGGGCPPRGGPGGQRLEPVMEGVPSGGAQQGEDSGPQLVVQRSALSGQGEGSVRHGREGLVRDGASFETALGTVTKAEARAVAAAGKGAGDGGCEGGGGAETTAAGSPLPSALVGGGTGTRGGHGHGNGHGHGLAVRFAVGVAECA